ncbi:hypothetical protein [Geoglobus acetivorans]
MGLKFPRKKKDEILTVAETEDRILLLMQTAEKDLELKTAL